MKKHNSTVKHLLEVKRFKESTTTSTLWDLTPPEERYLTYIDRIDEEQIQPKPVKHFKEASRNYVGLKPVEIPLKRRGLTRDPKTWSWKIQTDQANNTRERLASPFSYTR